jgi:hypothetical protein
MNKTILILVIIISSFGCKKDSLKDTDLLKSTWILSYGWLGAKEKNWFGSWSRLNK